MCMIVPDSAPVSKNRPDDQDGSIRWTWTRRG
eukprot:COSAG01_NODE_72455_length_253_cov_0.525974_1_plen_31_part_01